MAPRILIVKLSSLGDVVHTLPAAQLLRRAFPDAHLGWAVERAHADILERQPWLDERIVWNRGRTRDLWDFMRRLRGGGWDIAIDFQGLLRSALVTRFSGARRTFGYAPCGEHAHWLYHTRLPLETMERHAVDRSLALARGVIEQLGASVVQESFSRPFPLLPSAQDILHVEEWLSAQGVRADERLVLLNPHCRKDANRWPIERFSELAHRLLEVPKLRVALVGGKIATDVCDAIAKPLGNRVLRADGVLSLLASSELIRRADAFVTGDTGPMHLAAATGTPIVALFGPANPLRTGPYTSTAQVLQHKLPCSPCYARHGCPLGHAVPPCMAEITVDSVFAAVQHSLQTASARRSA